MEERPVEDERSDENSQGETPRFREGERLGEAFGGDPITVVDTQASKLKGDQASVGVDLDVLPRTGKDKIFPQGKTNNYVLKNVTGAMRETEYNFAFDTIANKPRERYEVLNTIKNVSENMSLFFGKDAVPQTFAIARCRVVEGDGLRPNSNKDEWTVMGKDLYTGIIDKVSCRAVPMHAVTIAEVSLRTPTPSKTSSTKSATSDLTAKSRRSLPARSKPSRLKNWQV